MRLLVPLLVMAGLLSVTMGLLVMVLKQGESCTESFQCENLATLETAMAGVTWFSIGFILWCLAGILVWMRRKFDNLPI